MKKFGSKSGFTLVELIVVIAILGILAGIAVPAYSGYIKKANEAADYAQLDATRPLIDILLIPMRTSKTLSSRILSPLPLTRLRLVLASPLRLTLRKKQVRLLTFPLTTICLRTRSRATPTAVWTPADG